MKTLTSLNNPIVKHAVKIRTSKKYRTENSLSLVSGKNNTLELATLIPPYSLFLTKELVSEFSTINSEVIYICSKEIIKKITKLPSPDGVCALFPTPKERLASSQHVIYIDRLQDPGNLGTIVRSMLAFSWGQLLLHPDSVDLFNEKTIRASKAACFKLPYALMGYSELKKYSKKHRLPIVLADIKGSNPESYDASQGSILVLGCEGQGILMPTKEDYKSVSIPMNPQCESLNVGTAASILMYLMKKDRKYE